MAERLTPRCGVTILVLMMLALAACQSGENPPPVEVEGGEPERGAELIVEYGCGECHRIAGIEGADGRTAPALTLWPNRAQIANVLRNNPENTAAFIQAPEEYVLGSEMPNLGLSDQEALDITAYLFTLR